MKDFFILVALEAASVLSIYCAYSLLMAGKSHWGWFLLVGAFTTVTTYKTSHSKKD